MVITRYKILTTGMKINTWVFLFTKAKRSWEKGSDEMKQITCSGKDFLYGFLMFYFHYELAISKVCAQTTNK